MHILKSLNDNFFLLNLMVKNRFKFNEFKLSRYNIPIIIWYVHDMSLS